MDNLKNRIYQKIADRQRQRHVRGGGEGWPGKSVGMPAITRYPNILAELDASGYWLPLMAEFAEVSLEIMVAVVEDNEDLSLQELVRLAHFWEHRGPSYLASPTLQVVDPETNKGKARRRYLKDLLEQADSLGLGFNGFPHPDPNTVLKALEDGRVITFAAYWWACHNIKRAMAIEAQKKKKVRGARLERAVSA